MPPKTPISKRKAPLGSHQADSFDSSCDTTTSSIQTKKRLRTLCINEPSSSPNQGTRMSARQKLFQTPIIDISKVPRKPRQSARQRLFPRLPINVGQPKLDKGKHNSQGHPFSNVALYGTESEIAAAFNDAHKIADPIINLGYSGQASYQQRHPGMIVDYRDSGDNSYTCGYCGAYFWLNEALKMSIRKNANAPIYTGCCQNGEVRVPQSQKTPAFLDTLLSPNNGRKSILFRENIRVYNSMFAFTSMGAKIIKDINNEPGPYVFKICGQVHHLMGSVLPPRGNPPQFAQLYVYDTSNEVSNRITAIDPCNENAKTCPHIVKGLIDMFDQVNVLTQAYRTVRDAYENLSLPSFNMTILQPAHTDTRQYDLPASNEIAALIEGDIGEFNSNKDIIIQSNDGHLKRISRLHPKYISLQYPLLFPYGDDGWTTNLRLEPIAADRGKKRTHLTMGKYIAYQIHDRANDCSPLLKGGRLFQQYLVDAYATVEENTLYYHRLNQDKLRSESHKGICKAMSSGKDQTADIGNRILLPASYTGSPRDMTNNYQDAMAICRQYGNPDLFITFTCNVKWPEITRFFERNPGYKPEDRPDIISRIFKLKLDDLLAYIKSGEPFGQVEAHVETIENQKRGLPHCHMLVWLEKSFKCYSSTDVDSIISAELPDKDLEPRLFDIVSQFMIHGPCGTINNQAPCMRNGKKKHTKCSKLYPKDFNEHTTFDALKPPVYRRRDDDTKFVVKNGVHVGNNFVVPYNRMLSLRFNAHINVESCSQSMLIKYLFKYINKGTDRARILIRQDQGVIDEIQTYMNCRYLTPHEATWRLLEFSIHSRYPAIQLLQIHLPNEQSILFKDTDPVESLLENPIRQVTMLTRWFDRNQFCEEARQLTYAEFPTKFVWNPKDKIWNIRQRYKTIGRISYIPPMVGELYYMKLLLNIQKGCRNYGEIKKVGDVVHRTYQEACMALGLLADDKAWDATLTESAFTSTSHEIRTLFVMLLLFCQISNPKALLQSHLQYMSDDILYKARQESGQPDLILPESELQNDILFELEKLLTDRSSSLKKFKLPMPDANKRRELANRLLNEELDYDRDALRLEHENLIGKLNSDQRNIYDAVIQAIEKKQPQCFFVHGSGGTGKTFLWHTIITKMRSEGKIVLAVASSGIASLLLPNGRTAHSRFKIPLKVEKHSYCQIKKGKHLAALLQRTDLIIWDEAPMSNKFCFEALHRSLKNIMSSSEDIASTSNNDLLLGPYELPFAEKTVLLGGDFRQILPVVAGGGKEQIIMASLNHSFLWPKIRLFHLKENMRLSKPNLSDEEKNKIAEFAKWMLDIGEGQLPSAFEITDFDTSWIDIPAELLTDPNIDPIQSIFEATYPDFNVHFNDIDYLRERAIVTPRNQTVQNVNNYVLLLLPGDETVYYSADTITASSGNHDNLNLLYPPEFLNKMEFSGFPTHKLILKIGIPIMLLRNLNSTNGLCNGTRLIITRFFNRLIEARILTGSNIGDRVLIPRIIMTTTETKWPFEFKRRQFPIRVCYAMTINKSQGQSIDHVGIYLPEPVFTHGQLYVAMSRVTSKNGLKIMINNSDDVPNNYTKNIVYKDVLHNLDA